MNPEEPLPQLTLEAFCPACPSAAKTDVREVASEVRTFDGGRMQLSRIFQARCPVCGWERKEKVLLS